jgi:hypothetical protein
LYFLRIFEVYTNFWKYNQKRKIRRKKSPHGAGPASAHGPSTIGLAHDHFSLADPANGAMHV